MQTILYRTDEKLVDDFHIVQTYQRHRRDSLLSTILSLSNQTSWAGLCWRICERGTALPSVQSSVIYDRKVKVKFLA